MLAATPSLTLAPLEQVAAWLPYAPHCLLRPSSRSSPTPSCTIVEFCDAYNLGEHAEMGLEKLGFRFGDDLNALRAEEYKEAGFKPLEWKRVLKAYRRLKQDTRLTQ